MVHGFRIFVLPLFAGVAGLTFLACSADNKGSSATVLDSGTSWGLDDGGAPVEDLDASPGPPDPVDGGYPYAGGVIRTDRFVTKVVSFTPGACAGFGATRMPKTVFGPPVGGGDDNGGLDVVSLGTGGEIVLAFEPNAIVDGDGVDFIVFENPFLTGGDPESPAAEVGEVSVSEDGTTWKTFPCTATAFPYGTCAGWHPVQSNPENGLSPVDPAVAGGDPFDLSEVGLTKARFVKIVDKTHASCGGAQSVNKNGFDLDAISIVHAEMP
jgi:hypothetical protein